MFDEHEAFDDHDAEAVGGDGSEKGSTKPHSSGAPSGSHRMSFGTAPPSYESSEARGKGRSEKGAMK